ncbi:hypothetical protein SDC9_96438 [bioreactor metagenome]|uniref:Uncharacterized protein n=1 Tax=bioreactor metagenome TaxID=1076179 RepID=A0A645AAI8_9ZZZZ
MGGESEAIPQGPGQQPCPGRRPHQRERGDLDRDGGRAGALADDDVDPEVLHRQVEQFFGGPAHPMDFVQEEYFALGKPRQDGGQITGVLDGRSRGDVQRHPHLVGDDHRQGGLAQPWRARQEYMIGSTPPVSGGLQHQAELVDNTRLTFEIVQRRGTQCALAGDLVGRRPRVNRGMGHSAGLLRLGPAFAVLPSSAYPARSAGCRPPAERSSPRRHRHPSTTSQDPADRRRPARATTPN